MRPQPGLPFEGGALGKGGEVYLSVKRKKKGVSSVRRPQVPV